MNLRSALRSPGLFLAAFALFALFAIVVVNTWQPWLVVDVQSKAVGTASLDAGDSGDAAAMSTAQVFGAYDHLPLRALATPAPNARLRMPAVPGHYVILGAEWRSGPIVWPVPLRDLRFALEGSGAAGVALQDGLAFDAVGADTQILVPAPPRSWLWAVRLAPMAGAALLCAAFAFFFRRRTLPLALVYGAVAALFALFVYQCFGHGALRPFYDDWRYFLPKSTSLFDAHWPWLGSVSNDTYYWTGQLLDFVVLKAANDSFIVQRSLSFLLLGLFVLLQLAWLARRAALPPIALAVASLLCGYVLAADGYWGLQAIAYHQFLPLLCAVAILLLVPPPGARGAALRYAGVGVLALLAGLAYISGAVAMLVLGGCMLFIDGLPVGPAARPDRRRAGWIVLCAGLATAALQLYVVTLAQGSLLAHNHAVPSVYPNDWRFWAMFTALFGKGVGYNGYSLPINAGLTVLLLAPGVVLGLRRLVRLVRPGAVPPASDAQLYAIAATALALVYAALVSFGRAGFTPPTATWVEAAWGAKYRFHYWWIAALVPALWLAWRELDASALLRRHAGAAFVIATALFLVPKSVAPWDYAPSLHKASVSEVGGSTCILHGIADPAANRDCNVGVPGDTRSAFTPIFARHPALFEQLRSNRPGARTAAVDALGPPATYYAPPTPRPAPVLGSPTSVFADQCCDANAYLGLGMNCASGPCYEPLRPLGAALWFSLPVRLGLPVGAVLLQNLLPLLLAIGFGGRVLSGFLAQRTETLPRWATRAAGYAISAAAHGVFFLPLVVHSLSDGPAAAFALIGAWALLDRRDGAWQYALAGAAFGAAVAMRSFYLYPVLAVVVVQVGVALLRRPRRFAPLAFCVALLPIAVQFAFVHSHTGSWGYIDPAQEAKWSKLHLTNSAKGYDTLMPPSSSYWPSGCAAEGGWQAFWTEGRLADAACLVAARTAFYFGTYVSRTYVPAPRDATFDEVRPTSVLLLVANLALFLVSVVALLRGGTRWSGRSWTVAVFVVLIAAEALAIIPEQRFIAALQAFQWAFGTTVLLASCLRRRPRESAPAPVAPPAEP